MEYWEEMLEERERLTRENMIAHPIDNHITWFYPRKDRFIPYEQELQTKLYHVRRQIEAQEKERKRELSDKFYDIGLMKYSPSK